MSGKFFWHFSWHGFDPVPWISHFQDRSFLTRTSRTYWVKSVKITFFLSSMSLVWTYTVMVPFLRGNTYQRENCILKGVSGVPTECQNHTYFQNMNLNRGVSIFHYRFGRIKHFKHFIQHRYSLAIPYRLYRIACLGGHEHDRILNAYL